MTRPEPTLSPVTEADAEALAELRVRAMRPSLEAIGRFDPQRARARLLLGFDAAATRAIVHQGHRVGFIVVRPEDGGLLLDHLYIEPSAQGRGLGSAVLRCVIAEARDARLPLRLGALRGSPANDFYRRHGFQTERESEWDIHYILQPA